MSTLSGLRHIPLISLKLWPNNCGNARNISQSFLLISSSAGESHHHPCTPSGPAAAAGRGRGTDNNKGGWVGKTSGSSSSQFLSTWTLGRKSEGSKFPLGENKNIMVKARPVVFCGPSGAGKSTLVKILLKEFPDVFGFSISHTTRKARPGELDGREYYFVTREVMEEAIKRGEFIESAEFSGNLYGTSKRAVEDVQKKGKMCILDIDVQGVKQIKETSLEPRLIFVKPPSLEDLERRLRSRGTETEETLKRRLDVAETEMKYGETPGNFDIVLVNDEVDTAYQKLRAFLLPDITELRDYLAKTKLTNHNGSGDKN